MANAFRSQQNSVVQIQICLSPIAERFPCVENERDIHALFCLPCAKTQERLSIIYQRFKGVLGADKIKSLSKISASGAHTPYLAGDSPAINSGNSFFKVIQSSVYQSISSEVMDLIVEYIIYLHHQTLAKIY